MKIQNREFELRQLLSTDNRIYQFNLREWYCLLIKYCTWYQYIYIQVERIIQNHNLSLKIKKV